MPRLPAMTARRCVVRPLGAGGCRRVAATVAVVALAVMVLGCEPVDEPLPAPGEQPEVEARDDADAEVLGAPEEDMPGDLDQLVERTEPEASRWQPDPRPAEAAVTLDGERWREASVTYAAAEADSMLVVRVNVGGVSTERINFEPIGLEPLPTDAIADLPPLERVSAPVDLAAAAEDRFSACGAESPAQQVRLATGVPASWEGDGWAQPPRWEAVVTDAAGMGVRLEAATGDPVDDDSCIETTVPEDGG